MPDPRYDTTCKGEGCGVPIKAYDERHEFCPKCWRKIQLKMCDKMDAFLLKCKAENDAMVKKNDNKRK